MVLSRLSRRLSRIKASYLLGLFFIFLVACIWAGASVLIQYIYSDLSFNNPFMLTMICTSLFSLYLPWVYLCSQLGIMKNPPFARPDDWRGQQGNGYYTTVEGDGVRLVQPIHLIPTDDAMNGQTSSSAAAASSTTSTSPPPPTLPSQYISSSIEENGRWSHLKTMRISLVIFPLFFIANFSYNVSLAHTSVTSNTIISTTSSLWTFLFSTLYGFTWPKTIGLLLSIGGTMMVGLSDENSTYLPPPLFSTLYGLERFTWPKMVGLLLSIGGTIMVGLSDQNSGKDTLAGDLLCIFAAIMYGVYTTTMRIMVPDDSTLSFQLLFGYLGLFGLLSLSPIVLILLKINPHMFTGFTATVFGFIVMNGLCDNVLSDYLWARSIILTSPTVATVGLSLTIPLAFISDTLLGKVRGSIWKILGALAVAAGFVLVSYKREVELEEEAITSAAEAEDDEGVDIGIGRGGAAGGGGGEGMGVLGGNGEEGREGKEAMLLRRTEL